MSRSVNLPDFCSDRLTESAQPLTSAVMTATKAGKAAYAFSADAQEGKVLYVCGLPKGQATKDWNARTWASVAAQILNGKGGGKDEQAQGVGTDVAKVGLAEEAVRKAYAEVFDASKQ